MDEALGSSSSGPVARLLAKGDPAEEIENVVRRTPVDLIVMGTQGLSGASRIFFGSTTERVLRRATVPVLAVPRGARPSALPASRSKTRIIAALELGRHMKADAHTAASIARWWQSDLILVHVVKPVQAPRWLRTHLRDRDRVMLDGARTRLEAIVRGLDSDLGIHCEVRLGDPAEQVSALAADARASLVLVILRARPGFFSTPQGATTYRVLCGTGTAVLAIPNRGVRVFRELPGDGCPSGHLVNGTMRGQRYPANRARHSRHSGLCFQLV